MIPFHDMKARHSALRGEFMRAIGEVIDSGEFAGGAMVQSFEHEFAAYCGCPFAVGVGSGTEALWLTMAAMGIGPGDEVVTVPMTFAATVEAICLTGAKPVFADIDPRTYTMDPGSLERALTPRTKAVVPVHLFGQCADMDRINAIARHHHLRVIEDAAQAHGAEYHNRKAGSLGDAGCFSFYPAKNLGAFGQGGAIIAHDEELIRRLRMLRDHGQSGKNRHTYVGWNSRLDAIQAAVLRVKLTHLDRENRIRRDHALRYDRLLADQPGLLTPGTGGHHRHIYHIYSLRVRDRWPILQGLEERQIGFGIHYPVPVHLQPAYKVLGHQPGDFPVAEQCAEEFVSLPMYPELTREQIALVAETVLRATGGCIAA